MHESQQRGKLLLNGAPMPDEALARAIGLDKQNLTTTLTTLLTYGVASRCPDTGALMSRRMVRDEDIRQSRANAGKMGGNPVLLNHKDKQIPTTQDKQKPTPSSSSSSSSSDDCTPPPLQEFELASMSPEAAMADLKRHFPDIDVWGEYQKLKQYCSKQGSKPTWRGLLGWLKKASPLAKLKKGVPVETINIPENSTPPISLEEQATLAEELAAMRKAQGI